MASATVYELSSPRMSEPVYFATQADAVVMATRWCNDPDIRIAEVEIVVDPVRLLNRIGWLERRTTLFSEEVEIW